MWEVIGELGTTGDQISYAVGAVGTHYNNLASTFGGLQGLYNLATD